MPRTAAALTNAAAKERRKVNAERRLARSEEAYCLMETKRYVNQIHTAIDVLDRGWEEKREMPLTRDRVASIKAAADLSLAMLKKTVPDLKAIEVSDLREMHTGEDPKQLTTEQLVAIVLQQRGKQVIQDAEYVEVSATESGQQPPWEKTV